MRRAKHRATIRQGAIAWFHQACDGAQRWVPVRFLQHAAAGLATILVVWVVAIVAANNTAPDQPSAAMVPSPTRVFPDEPRGGAQVPGPTLAVSPAPVETRTEPPRVVAPKLTARKPVPVPPRVIVAVPAPQVVTPHPGPVVVTPGPTPDPLAPVAKPHRVQRDKPDLQLQPGRRIDPEPEQKPGLCAVVCVELGGNQPDDVHGGSQRYEQEDED